LRLIFPDKEWEYPASGRRSMPAEKPRDDIPVHAGT
jgi:hypothetical protein